jgi:hypothetical protein
MLFGPILLVLGSRAREKPGRSSSSRFSSGTSVSQSVGSLLRSSTGTRTNSSRAPLSSTRVSCCVFGRRRSSDGSSPVRRRTSFTATSLKPGFLYQGTPSGGYGTGRHCRSRLPCSTRLRRPTRLAVSSTKTNARPDTEHDRVSRTPRGTAVPQHHKGGGVVFQHQELPCLGPRSTPKGEGRDRRREDRRAREHHSTLTRAEIG